MASPLQTARLHRGVTLNGSCALETALAPQGPPSSVPTETRCDWNGRERLGVLMQLAGIDSGCRSLSMCSGCRRASMKDHCPLVLCIQGTRQKCMATPFRGCGRGAWIQTVLVAKRCTVISEHPLDVQIGSLAAVSVHAAMGTLFPHSEFLKRGGTHPTAQHKQADSAGGFTGLLLHQLRPHNESHAKRIS